MTGLVTKRKPSPQAGEKRWQKVKAGAFNLDLFAKGRQDASARMAELTAIHSGPAGDATVAYTQKLHWAVLDLIGAEMARFAGTMQIIKGLESRIAELETAQAKSVQPMIYRGVFVDGETYDAGNTATFGGSLWHCNTSTKERPGDGSKMWTLCVKRGRDGKDLRP